MQQKTHNLNLCLMLQEIHYASRPQLVSIILFLSSISSSSMKIALASFSAVVERSNMYFLQVGQHETWAGTVTQVHKVSVVLVWVSFKIGTFISFLFV